MNINYAFLACCNEYSNLRRFAQCQQLRRLILTFEPSLSHCFVLRMDKYCVVDLANEPYLSNIFSLNGSLARPRMEISVRAEPIASEAASSTAGRAPSENAIATELNN